MKNILAGKIYQLDTIEKKTSEIEGIVVDILQNQSQRENMQEEEEDKRRMGEEKEEKKEEHQESQYTSKWIPEMEWGRYLKKNNQSISIFEENYVYRSKESIDSKYKKHERKL